MFNFRERNEIVITSHTSINEARIRAYEPYVCDNLSNLYDNVGQQYFEYNDCLRKIIQKYCETILILKISIL